MSFEELWGIGEGREEIEDVNTIIKDTSTKGKINCAGCGGLFKPKRRNQKYCKPACRIRAQRKRISLKKK